MNSLVKKLRTHWKIRSLQGKLSEQGYSVRDIEFVLDEHPEAGFDELLRRLEAERRYEKRMGTRSTGAGNPIS